MEQIENAASEKAAGNIVGKATRDRTRENRSMKATFRRLEVSLGLSETVFGLFLLLSVRCRRIGATEGVLKHLSRV